MNNIILSTKLKNAITNAAPDLNLDFKLKTIKVNDDKRGCSGFVINKDNNSIVYVNTEKSTYLKSYLYRYADSDKDYTGYHNRFANTLEELATAIADMLNKTPAEVGDRR